jgi:hypothetical protein
MDAAEPMLCKNCIQELAVLPVTGLCRRGAGVSWMVAHRGPLGSRTGRRTGQRLIARYRDRSATMRAGWPVEEGDDAVQCA